MIRMLSFIFMLLGILFLLFGTLGLFRFKHFYHRILMAGLIDTVGFITLSIGIIFYAGLNWFSFKIIILIVITLVMSATITHSITRSAFFSGYKIPTDQEENE